MSLARLSLRPALRAGSLAAKPFSTSLARSKHTLPDLPYDFNALEPFISARIMEVHYTKHHQTYVTNLNNILDTLSTSLTTSLPQTVSLQRALNFHAGGHLNHTLFWENLSPSVRHGGVGGNPPSGELAKQIDSKWGSFENFQKEFNASLAAIQGSGWSWLVKDAKGELSIVERANQDPVVGGLKPILGVDAWEHAYYLQYENRKVEYFDAIWNVLNWKTAEKRFSA